MIALSMAALSLDRIVTDETQRSPSRGLIASMAAEGLLRPLDVRLREDGLYELVDGSRRLAGAKTLGWATIDAIVEPAGEDCLPRDLKALLLNTQRQNLQQLYLARHARRLLQQHDWSQAELARRTHRSRSALCKMLGVLDCADLVAALDRHELAFGAARALAPLLPDDRRQLLAELAEIARREKRFPSVRRVEARVRCRQSGAAAIEPATERLAEVIEELRLRGVPLEIQARPGKKSGLKVMLTLAKADLLWLRGFLADESAGAAESGSDAARPAAESSLPRGNEPADDLQV